MKIHIIATILFCLFYSVQGKDLDLKDGRVLKDYKIVNHSPNDVMVIYEEGAVSVKMKNLPDELQKKYGYNKEDSERYKKERERKEKERVKQLRAKNARRKAKRKLLEKANHMEFHVFQVYDSGFLVNKFVDDVVASSSARIGGGGNVYSYKKPGDKLYYVTGYPSSGVVEGDTIDGKFIKAGTHTYTTIIGAMKTVKKYEYLKNIDKRVMKQSDQPSPESTIPGLAAVDLHGNLTEKGFNLEKDLGGKQSKWLCEKEEPHGYFSATAFGPWADEIEVVKATVTYYGNDQNINKVASNYLGFIASLPYENSKPRKARAWVKENISSNSKTVIGGVKYEIFANAPRARILRMSAAK